MPRAHRLVAVTLLSTLAFVGALPGTAAFFTAEKQLPGNTAITATLTPPHVTADTITNGSAALSWTAGPTGGVTPSYTLTRSNADNAEPTEIYAGTSTGFTDHGNLPSFRPTSLSAGSDHSLAVNAYGSVWAWGDNTDGQLGDGTNARRTTPVDVNLRAGMKATAIAAGAFHSLALDAHGDVWAWGNNDLGELGTGSTAVNDNVPAQVAFPEEVKITAIAAGGYHSLALDTDGNVWAWGWNRYGQLGSDAITEKSNKPIKVALPTGVEITAIAAGGLHSLAIDAGQNVYAWGQNVRGQLGSDGTEKYSKKPVRVAFPDSVKITAIAAGGSHSLAVDTDHNVYAWGSNDNGQLGDGDSGGQKNVPSVVGFASGTIITAIAAGGSHSVAIDTDHNVYAWGSNDNGQLGNGDTSPGEVNAPGRVHFGLGKKITTIAAGGFHSLAIDTTHDVFAWGKNASGQLGNGEWGEAARSDVPVSTTATWPACPKASTPLSGTITCSLAAHTIYQYTVTTRIGSWTTTSEPLRVTTEPSP